MALYNDTLFSDSCFLFPRLTAQLSRDLQNDFYVYFPRFFQTISNLLNTQDTDMIEWCFQCLSFLFKFLWRYMLNDLSNVYDLYSPLFEDTKKIYIKNFAAESFAFLMRKVQDKNRLFAFLFERLQEHENEAYGIAKLIFEMFKGVKRQFNSCTDDGLKALLNRLNSIESKDRCNECINQVIQFMSEYTTKEHSNVIWNGLSFAIEENARDFSKLNAILGLVKTFVEYQNGYLISNLDSMINKLCLLTSLAFEVSNTENLEFVRQLFDLCKILVLAENVKFPIDKIRLLISQLYQEKFELNLVCDLTIGLFDSEMFTELVLPNFLNFMDLSLKTANEKTNGFVYQKKLFSILSQYLSIKKFVSKNSIELFPTKPNKSDTTGKANILNAVCKSNNLAQFIRLFQDKQYQAGLNKHLFDYVAFRLSNNQATESGQLSMDLIEILILCPFLSLTDAGLVSKQLMCLYDLIATGLSVKEMLTDASDEYACLLISFCIWAMIVSNNVDLIASGFVRLTCDLLKKCDSFQLKCILHLLRSLDFLVSLKCDLNPSHVDLIGEIDSIFVYLKKQLSSPYYQVSRIQRLRQLMKKSNANLRSRFAC
jgi:hypothetical protein